MKSSKNLVRKGLYLIVTVLVSFQLISCDDSTLISSPPHPQDELTMIPDRIYIGIGKYGNYNDPVGFYERIGHIGEINSTLPPMAQIIEQSFPFYPNKEWTRFKFTYPVDTFSIDARLTPFKFSEMPTYNSMRPYNGLGVVQERNIVWQYDQAIQRISIFDIISGSLKEVYASYARDTVYIADGRRLEPHVFNPHPGTTSLHDWFDGWADRSTSYAIFRH